MIDDGPGDIMEDAEESFFAEEEEDVIVAAGGSDAEGREFGSESQDVDSNTVMNQLQG